MALIGYGKMGQMIEKSAISRGHDIVAKINSQEWDSQALAEAEIAIEFTHPDAVIENITKLAKLKKNIIIGTTGWYENIDKVRSIASEHNIGVVYASNYSIGMHLFFHILAHASKLVNVFKEYDVACVEYHHNQKKDSPSGTAIEMAKIIEAQMDRIDSVPISSIRCGSIPGTHTVLFDSFCDTLSITHEARNREGFALGAVLAAEWIKNKQGIYTFSDCLQDIIKERSL